MKPPFEYVLQAQDPEAQRKFEEEVEGIIKLHDFIRAHPDSAVKDIAKFMPPVNAKVVTEAILRIEERERKKN